MRHILAAITIFATSLSLPAMAQNRPPLGQVPQVTEPLVVAAMVYEIDRVCGALNIRLLRGIGFLNGIKSTARSLGYSNAEIDAFVDDRTEKNRLEEVARSRLRERGAIPDQPETYCALGRAEISAGSEVGRLLR
ncbi:DUF5333 domain-containing protein [Ketogulonicigenium vulgare]|uniref:DUF5333 domain-containing protein n=1 Tax=Ketogulonicigenium vulgare TaxID=92945 RepID=UPI0023592D8D|nr:DUF5333 domain-containing protein [Ketogulonicigenium vulgare]